MISVGAVTLWGLWLLNPAFTFAYSKGFLAFGAIAPKEAWAGFALTIGVIDIIGLYRRSRFMRLVALSGVMTYRLFTLFLTIQGSHFIAPGIPDYFFWFILALAAMMSA